MTTTDKIPILGSKAVIFKNKYDVWQFRMYVKNARRYVEKSLTQNGVPPSGGPV
jgi:hypothetical protein